MAQVSNLRIKPVGHHVINSNTIAALKTRLDETPDNRPIAPKALAGLHGHNPKHNGLLAALPAADYDRLLPHLEFVEMPFGTTICAAGEKMQYAYFLSSSIVSLLYETADGASSETAVIGYEGLVGVDIVMGGGASLNRAFVKSAGYGFRIKASVLKEEFARGGALQQLLLRFTQALFSQMAHTVACNRHHTIVQQLCRWLLLSLDRLPTNKISMTQDLIANMLGVRRESVTEAARKLQDEGLIHYSRGQITVVDRAGLEEQICECYTSLKKEYDGLLAANER
ncbi:Crp/Fnr family transcriptional regulator [Herminiimonas fonticola]|uniref:CRP-like cAMP-binding protein n=1 Tax=Herminiimonas fonticola TaxID=303380 RepID=A0A4R6GI35_9BURK|nr:Crp/Fnr family transcriptional regulator [Herminiimonas fonticola]RBA25509.1 cAMP-binding protein [Herminiimonas fonticola]TDN94622.1 CRP-like cAMP-binding protein [Herminiimonas fonticola]